MRLQGKVTLLSGAGPGMGRATARLFAQEGAKVVVVARRPDHLDETVSAIRAAGGEGFAIQADVSVVADAARAVEMTLERHGRVDVLYSGGGGFFEPTRDFDDVDTEYWHRALSNTMNGIFNLSHAVRPPMKSQGGGAIVVVAASESVRLGGNPAYSAAKGGTIEFARSLARKLHPDAIRVNVIAPGLIRGKPATGFFTPADGGVGRIGVPQDVAYAALYLASDEASWVTGQVLTVDGGVDVGARGLWDLER